MCTKQQKHCWETLDNLSCSADMYMLAHTLLSLFVYWSNSDLFKFVALILFINKHYFPDFHLTHSRFSYCQPPRSFCPFVGCFLPWELTSQPLCFGELKQRHLSQCCLLIPFLTAVGSWLFAGP